MNIINISNFISPLENRVRIFFIFSRPKLECQLIFKKQLCVTAFQNNVAQLSAKKIYQNLNIHASSTQVRVWSGLDKSENLRSQKGEFLQLRLIEATLQRFPSLKVKL